MHKLESVMENETQKVLLNFQIQRVDLILARRPNLKKWICRIVDFAVPADQRVKIKENEKII